MPYVDIFPSAVSITSIERNFTEEELKVVDEEYKTAMQNIGNMMGLDQYVLNRPELANIKATLEQRLNDYLQDVFAPSNDLEIYITQSWFSWLNPGQYFHEHQHQNSLISGCLYFNADRNQDAILLHKKEFQQIYIPAVVEKTNKWNSQIATIPVDTGNIVLFPSKITHSVAPTHGNYVRTTLAFNSFIRGSINHGYNLLDLHLK
jgi:uncharacterized protein (TIGR02466 family)